VYTLALHDNAFVNNKLYRVIVDYVNYNGPEKFLSPSGIVSIVASKHNALLMCLWMLGQKIALFCQLHKSIAYTIMYSM
jgi:hypothetical protein